MGALVAEAAAVSLLFDAESVKYRGGPFSLLGRAGYVLTFLASAATAFLLIAANRRDGLATLGRETWRRRPHAIALAVHAAAHTAFVALSFDIFEPGAPTDGRLWLVAGAWLGACLVAFASLVLAVCPARAAVRLLVSSRRTLAKAVVVGGLAWTLGILAMRVWDSLTAITLEAVAWLLSLIEPEVVLDPEERLIGVPAFMVRIDQARSGVERIGLVLAFVALFVCLDWRQLRLRRVWVLFLGAAFAAWVSNVLRIGVLVQVGAHFSADLALSGFHSKLGWAFFCVVSLLAVAVARRVAFFRLEAERPPDDDTWNPTAVYLAPLMAMLGASLLSGLLESGFDTAYGIRVAATLVALLAVRRRFGPLRMPVSWQAVGIGLVTLVLWVLLMPPPDPDALDSFAGGLRQMPPAAQAGWLTLRVVGAAVTVPLAEELAFRGYLLPRLISADFLSVDPRRLTWFSLIGSSVVFGLLHERWLRQPLPAAYTGLHAPCEVGLPTQWSHMQRRMLC